MTTQLKNNGIEGIWLTCFRIPLTTEGEFFFDYTV